MSFPGVSFCPEPHFSMTVRGLNFPFSKYKSNINSICLASSYTISFNYGSVRADPVHVLFSN